MDPNDPVRRVYIQPCTERNGWCVVLQCTYEGRSLWVELRGFRFYWTAMRKAKRFTEGQKVFFMQGRDFHKEQERLRSDA